jgi:sugar lactone lactonase YvrE
MLTAVAFAVLTFPDRSLADGRAFLDRLETVNQIASTVPANGDINPYGVAVVPRSVGALKRGQVLVSNFNNAANQQGTGTTIVQVSPKGNVSLFAQIDPSAVAGKCPGGVGLTTALVVLRRGWVIVGSLPTAGGALTAMSGGCLIVLDSRGQIVETFQGGDINGPWDMTVLDDGNRAWLFVTNVLNGNVATGSPPAVNQGTVVRIPMTVPEQGEGVPTVGPMTIIGSGFAETADPAALVIGPTGVGLAHDGTLYVADSLNNQIVAIPNALTRQTTAFTGITVSFNGALNAPLGLTIAPNGHIITANGGDGNLVETSPGGAQVAVRTVDTVTGAGSLFGLAIVPGGRGIYFVDDGDNTLKVLEGKELQENNDNDGDD